ncbi:BTAD domain-containing putative transcriptional regulator [Dactylosporangium maewongense]|uniref:BTAD domain-containing putative transcriptional regulator n=1 Tax=Dactylosporangium maewongense TaxID=634393 RepID=A0ABP4MWC6_9ACTN
MEFRLLGPIEAWTATRRLDAGPPRQRLVLAAVAADAGRLVPIETIIDRVWAGDAPDRARHALYVYVARLRGALQDGGASPLVRRSGGYVLDVDPEAVDLHRFRALTEQARDPRTSDTARVAALRQALDLWRGAPLADVAGPWAERMRESWRQQRLDAAVAWAQAALRLGQGGGDGAGGGGGAGAGAVEPLIGPLTELAAEHPYAESLAAALIEALHESGHQAEALDRYTRIRRKLVDDLGTEPGAELRDLHARLLRQAGAPETPAPQPAAPVPAAAQLPLDLHSFTGRTAELDRLDAILEEAVVLATVTGTAGVGKTSLTVHWAHRVAGRFPDGQLYADLNGFGGADTVVTPAQAVRGFLDALGVPPRRVPADLAAQTALFRSLTSGRRILIVLDNARDADHARPLLPGGPGCLVVVTSRTNLAGLIAAEGAQPVPLDLLTHGEATRLLARRLGRARLDAEPSAVDEIVAACAGLPLALAIVAARAALRPHQPLADLAAELRDDLDQFDVGDTRGDVRAVFSSSYRTLSDAAARLFRLIGLHPGPDISAPAAASLLGVPVKEARTLLADLVRAHLLTEPAAGRFAAHDLLRRYAAELAAKDPAGERTAATRRLLEYYLHTAFAATTLQHPFQVRVPDPAPPSAGVVPPALADQAAASRWFAAEYPVLTAAVHAAATTGFDSLAWQIAWTLTNFFQRQGRHHDWIATQRVALAAAHRCGDRHGEAHLQRVLGRGHLALANYDDAHAALTASLELFRGLDDPVGRAATHLNLGEVHEAQGDNAAALDHAEQALALYRTTDRPSSLAYALNASAWYHIELGDPGQAVGHCRQALALQQKIDDRHGQAATLDTLAYAHHRMGVFADAIACYRRAVALTHALADSPNEAGIGDRLGDALFDSGDLPAAQAEWRKAMKIYDELTHPAADKIRAKLAARLPQGVTG